MLQATFRSVYGSKAPQFGQEAAAAHRRRHCNRDGEGGRPRGSPGFGFRLAANQVSRLVARRLRPDKELPEALLLGPRWGDDLGGARPHRDDLRGARSRRRRHIVLRSGSSGEREAGAGSGKRGGRAREERGAAVVHAEGEPREEDERDEDPAERPHRLRGMPS